MILGIDQGTSGTRACLMDAGGTVRRRATATHAQHHPRPGWVEHDAAEIWACTQRVIDDATGGAGARVAALAIANQGETVLLWDRTTGRPLHHALVWQDLRAQPYIDDLARDPAVAARVAATTGLRLDAYFAAPKLRWLLDHVPHARALADAGRLGAGTLDTWLIWNLTGGASYVTDVSTAARTLLLDLRTLTWDPWLLELFGIPAHILPEVRPTAGFLGDAPVGPIMTSLVDQPAALFGEACLRPGQIKATFGTGCFVYLNAGTQAPPPDEQGLLATVAWQRDGVTTYALDGGVFSAGSALAWLRDELHLAGSDAELDALALSAAADYHDDDHGDDSALVFVPALAGLGAPHWRRDARAAWLGLDSGTTRAQLVAAAYEGIACRVAQVVAAMERQSGTRFPALRVDGGLTRSAPLMQRQADLLGIPLELSAADDATITGACWMAARAAGVWTTDDEITRRVATARTIEPRLAAADRTARLARFDRAVEIVCAWAR